MIGRTISHYRILAKLGEGGMGEVYRAHDEHLGRDVALKVLPADVALDPERLARFEREARSIAQLNHPNIVTIHSVEETDGVHFLTMELVEGRTLTELLVGGECCLDRFFELAIPLADAVTSAHAKGIVHRDLKPANIMVDDAGRLKVLDFGLAKLFEPGTEATLPGEQPTMAMDDSPTIAGSVLGTPDYMSPEQAEGKAVDHRSDLFSLGVILYEMATSKHPFRGGSPAATISSILRDTPPSATDVQPELPRHLGRIVSHCLEKETDRRYQSALDLRNDLEGLKRETESALREEEEDDDRGERRSNRRPGHVWIAIAAVVLITIALSYWQLRPGSESLDAGGDSARKMLVVLPFKNLGLPEDEYFADGITEEITARLAGIQDLGVIARTSANRYKNTEKSMQEIGQELGVGFVLEGTIRWQRISESESQVRVTPQLVQVADATNLWVEVYQKDMTDIFQVQSDIAEQVVRALNVTLMEGERRALAARPTENIEAYHAFLRGLDFSRHPSDSEEQHRMALQMFERAVVLDPEFARAYCRMAESHVNLYYFKYDRTPGRLTMAKEAVDRAMVLQPDLPEAHLALGWYYYMGFREYDRALSEFAVAAENLPNNADIHSGMAAVMRRQDRWETSIEHSMLACELDPQDADFHANTGISLKVTRRYAEAEHYFDQSILVTPDQAFAYIFKAQMLCLWKGDIDGARATLREIPEGIDYNVDGRQWIEVEIMGRDYPAVLERLIAWPEDIVGYPYYTIPKTLYIGLVYRYLDEADLATATFDSARIVLEGLAEEPPANWSLQSSLGIVYAGLDRKDEALQAGRAATELLPLAEDAIEGYDPQIFLAQIYTMVGEYAAALDLIEYLLTIPSDISVPILRLDPRWDPLRDQPRFQQILQEYSGGGS